MTRLAVASARRLAAYRPRTRLVAVVFATVLACGTEDAGPSPGSEGGPCRPEDDGDGPCHDGLLCASETCVDLSGAETEFVTTSPPSPGTNTSNAGTSGADEGTVGNSATQTDGGESGYTQETDASPPHTSGGAGTSPDSDSSPAESCPLTRGQLRCSSICAAERTGCDSGCNIPTGCAFFDMEECVENCEYWMGVPDWPDLLLLGYACRQASGGACDAWGDCYLNADCGS